MKTRMEHDSVGELPVPADAYYGVQALRAKENFPITGRPMHPELIRMLALVKLASARANRIAGTLAPDVADAIARACAEIADGALREMFIVDCVQGGAGTSANMNMNEVVANRALELLGEEKGAYARVHPNDHVNLGQSTNDVFPTAGKLAAYALCEGTLSALRGLREAFVDRAAAFDDVVKMGRTQLQDAVPIRLGQSFAAFAAVVSRDIRRIDEARQELLTVNMGATAIGTALNAHPVYLREIIPALAAATGLPVRHADDLIDATQNADAFAVLSGALKTCALSLSKISNDLRLLSSGPRTGLAEIVLPARQNGSSIMPGKINPVIPEVVNQTAFRVAGNDLTVSMAVEAGQMELNAFEPVMLTCLFESLEMLAGAAGTLERNCVRGIEANREACARHVRESIGTVTALCPRIGYARAAAIAKEALRTGETVAALAARETGLPMDEIERILDARSMT